jgi:hypothetical protein
MRSTFHAAPRLRGRLQRLGENYNSVRYEINAHISLGLWTRSMTELPAFITPTDLLTAWREVSMGTQWSYLFHPKSTYEAIWGILLLCHYIRIVSGLPKALSAEVNPLEHETDHSLPFHADIKKCVNVWFASGFSTWNGMGYILLYNLRFWQYLQNVNYPCNRPWGP